MVIGDRPAVTRPRLVQTDPFEKEGYIHGQDISNRVQSTDHLESPFCHQRSALPPVRTAQEDHPAMSSPQTHPTSCRPEYTIEAHTHRVYTPDSHLQSQIHRPDIGGVPSQSKQWSFEHNCRREDGRISDLMQTRPNFYADAGIP